MDIILYNNKSENERVTKEIEEISTLSGTLKEDVSIINPVIVVDMKFNTSANYCYIATFGRYYYITDIVILNNNFMEIHCKCDVLMSFADSIKSNSAILRRNKSEWNLYIDDGTFITYQDPNIVTKKFNYSFDNESYVLAISGAG